MREALEQYIADLKDKEQGLEYDIIKALEHVDTIRARRDAFASCRLNIEEILETHEDA